MTPHIDEGDVVVYLGDCREVMAGLDAESVDAVVTDPPYELGFMGHRWDASGIAYDEGIWRAALRVLKPGGHLLAFGGTRTFHRLACAIEDAGFEIRDSITWHYGCLTDDTEALTRRGWRGQDELTDGDELLQWDAATDSLSWARPERIVRAPYDGPIVRLQNRHTDQALTPNHRVYARIKRHSRNPQPDGYEVVEAGELRDHWIVDLPMAGMLADGEAVDPDHAYLVGWWLTDAWEHGDGKAVMFSQCKPATLERLRAALAPYSPSEYVKKPREPQHQPEHSFYVAGELAQRLLGEWPARHLDWRVLGWDANARQRLVDGLLDGDGSRPKQQHGATFWSKDQECRDIFTALCLSVGWRAYDDPRKGCVYANPRPSTQLQQRHRFADEHYRGIVWCVTVPTGAFVARRNGRPFITGNSGFPKSLDVSKAIDREAGAEREVVGDDPSAAKRNRLRPSHFGEQEPSGVLPLTAPATPEAARWQGWGTALKPSTELICVARKPLAERTVARQVLATGTGAINVDGCRVGTTVGTWPASRSYGTKAKKFNSYAEQEAETQATGEPPAGRWPPNLLLTHAAACEEGGGCAPGCPVREMDAQSGVLTSGVMRAGTQPKGTRAVYGQDAANGYATAQDTYADSGASRFFPRFRYEAKASGAERGEGNNHPTVKPIDLMRWLVRLVTPPGGTVLDPFAGSGTTLIAARREGLRAIGIEREPEYAAIIARRVAAEPVTLFAS